MFVDGDDTPWSKAFLASAYASRGIKVRFTSGGGSEALMGESEGKSMLYLEARCLSLVRAAGSQGVQNGSISCVALALAVPGGTREVLAENVLAAWLDLEVASGNDAIASHSEIRKTAKLMGQFLPGTDFVTSGYSSMPRYDNMFGGGNYDSDDLDEWLTIQRDWQVDAGIEPLDEDDAIAVRERAARAVQAVFDELGFPPISDEEVRLAATCLDSRDLPDRDRAADVAGRRPRARGGDQRPRRRAGARPRAASPTSPPRSSACSASASRRTISRRRRSSTRTGRSSRRSTTPNEYAGPGTGYRLEGARWERLQRLPHAIDARLLGAAHAGEPPVAEVGAAAARHARRRGRDRGRAGVRRRRSRDDQRPRHGDVLAALIDGVRERGRRSRGSSASGVRPTSPSSATTARGCPARASRSACSRRARR